MEKAGHVGVDIAGVVEGGAGLMKLGKGLAGVANSADEIVKITKGGAARAAQYSSQWENSSLQTAISKFAPEAEGVISGQKTIYTNADTGIQVVQDNAGNYFRIQDASISGKRSYLDMNGNIPNNKIVNGKQMGRSQAEYNQATHFNNID